MAVIQNPSPFFRASTPSTHHLSAELLALRHERAANDAADHLAPTNGLASSLFGEAFDLTIDRLEEIQRKADLNDMAVIDRSILRGSPPGSFGLAGSHGARG